MQTVNRLLPFFLPLLLLPSVAAVEPEDAPALWRETYGSDAILEVSLGAPVAEGEPILGYIRLREDADVTQIVYQICEVGESCFAFGVPLESREGAWRFDTSDLIETVGRPVPETYRAGQRIGVQFSLCQDAECDWATQTGAWMPFPRGLPEDDPFYDTDYTAWSETHYFATTIQEGEKDTPAAGPVLILAVLAVVRRWV